MKISAYLFICLLSSCNFNSSTDNISVLNYLRSLYVQSQECSFDVSKWDDCNYAP